MGKERRHGRYDAGAIRTGQCQDELMIGMAGLAAIGTVDGTGFRALLYHRRRPCANPPAGQRNKRKAPGARARFPNFVIHCLTRDTRLGNKREPATRRFRAALGLEVSDRTRRDQRRNSYSAAVEQNHGWQTERLPHSDPGNPRGGQFSRLLTEQARMCCNVRCSPSTTRRIPRRSRPGSGVLSTSHVTIWCS